MEIPRRIGRAGIAPCMLCPEGKCSQACAKGIDPARELRRIWFDNESGTAATMRATDACATCDAPCVRDCPVHVGVRDILLEIKAHADEWRLDVSRIALTGGSAGAATALYLGFKNNNEHGIYALAPIIPQTSMDPQEMKAWIPNSTYGAHAFGYRNFDDWLAHRADCLADIGRISPAALLRRIDAAKAPHVVFQAGRLPKPGQLVEPTHSPVFCAKFKEIADAKGVTCEFIQGGRLPCFGEAFVRIAEILTGRKVPDAEATASAAKAKVRH